jgi:hypothetical protein
VADVRTGPGPTLAATLATLLLAATLLASCAADPGDLGRPRPNPWNDAIFPAAGAFAASARGEAVSGFPLTDDEIILRDRAYRFVMPPHEPVTARGWFDAQVQELARTRILPVSAQATVPGPYLHTLLARPFRSERSRYHRLVEDAQADRALIGPFRHVARLVAEADRIRLRAVAHAVPEGPLRLRAEARVQENEGLVAWVHERLAFRVAEYRHALVRLVVKLPAHEAVLAERAVMALEAELGLLAPLVGGGFAPPAVVKH